MLNMDTKSEKEIQSHLNLQPPHSPIASEGEEILDIESFEERIARFDVETPVQQWYGDATSVASALTMVAQSGHPYITHLHMILLLWLIAMMIKTMKRAEKKKTTMSEAS
jgi:hypothetical protein